MSYVTYNGKYATIGGKYAILGGGGTPEPSIIEIFVTTIYYGYTLKVTIIPHTSIQIEPPEGYNPSHYYLILSDGYANGWNPTGLFLLDIDPTLEVSVTIYTTLNGKTTHDIAAFNLPV